jgi:hypothetical protein
MRSATVLLCLLAAGCGRAPPDKQANRVTDPRDLALRRQLPPPEAFIRREDQAAMERIRAGFDAPAPCANIERVDQCVRFTKPQRIRGLWRDEFEGSDFCKSPARTCAFRSPETSTWLSFADPKLERRQPTGALYVIDFIGRRSLYAGIGMYGHMGMSANEVIVDRMISIKQLEAPPPPPSKAEIIKHWKECEAAKSCIPNWEEINKMKE